MGDRMAVCVAGEAAWTATAYGGLGAIWRTENGVAWGPHVPHRFLLGAITLEPRPRLPVGLQGTLRDSWAALLEDDTPAGWGATPADPWMFRPAGLCVVPDLPDVTIRRTFDAELFERTAFLAASGSLPARAGELHPRGSEGAAGLRLFMAWNGGRPVGTALAVVHHDGVVVSAVAVMGNERRRGIGAALTATAVTCAPDRPATLTGSTLGLGSYLRMGFERVGTPLDWKPTEPSPSLPIDLASGRTHA